MTNTEQENKYLFENEFGGFDENTNEYVINHGAQRVTPRPWGNVMANKHFGTIVTESALGMTWCDNSKDKRTSIWSNDTVRDIPSEAIYIKDRENGKVWTTTRLPGGVNETKSTENYTTRHGNGYTVFESDSNEFAQVMTVFVDVEKQTKYIKVSLTNNSSLRRSLSLYYYMDVVLGNYKNQFDSFVRFKHNEEFDILEISRTDRKDFNKRIFMSSSEKISSWTSNRNYFVGYTGSLRNPHSLQEAQLNDDSDIPKENCCVIQTNVEVNPGETKDIVFLQGAFEHHDELQESLIKYKNI
jgi:cyclic beta-1,2-glucan synthetase